MLENLFKKEYSDISIDYNNIEKDIKEKLITKFKKRKKINNNITLKDIINIKNISIQAFTYLKNYRRFNSEINTNLLIIKDNNNNIVNKINLFFKRKGIKYEKDIYIIVNTEMKENIKNEKNIQYFFDVTHYATPPNNKKYRILIILSFNSELFRTLLCSISIITKKNKETFCIIFDYLKKNINLIKSL